MSTCVADYVYNKDTQTLTIYFVKGGSHTYTGIPQEIVDGLEGAGSKGQYFNANIRD